ncbi:MAG TPA: hypothetical protein VGK53_10480 [Propionicimonas sp.]
MGYSEFTNLSVADVRRAELRRELDEIRAARGLPIDDPYRPLLRRVLALRHRIGAAVARLRASDPPRRTRSADSPDAISARRQPVSPPHGETTDEGREHEAVLT